MGNTSSQSRSYESDSAVSSPAIVDDKSSNTPILQITTKSWNKNSFGLFDYESRDIQKKHLKVIGSCKLLRNEIIKDSVEIEALNEPLNKQDSAASGKEMQLARLFFKNGGYWIYHKNSVDLAHIYQNPEEKLWLVIKHYQSKTSTKGYRLEKNDIVKFGRVRLRVRDIDYAQKVDPYSAFEQQNNSLTPHQGNGRQSLTQRRITQDEIGISLDANDIELQDKGGEGGQQFEISLINNPLKLIAQSSKKSKSKKEAPLQDLNMTSSSSGAQCRICWGGEEDLEKDFNPLISPCNCIGTISSIHLRCLKEWLETKRTMKVHKGQVVIKFKKLDCELCKQMFPFQIAHNNRIVDIVEIERPDSDFIIFESLNSSIQKIFYIINTENKTQLKVGRGQDSDIRITDDISVSRCHATIKKTAKGDYYLEDFNSKFGTLVQVQYPIFLSPSQYNSQPIVFQSGKSCLQIQLKQTATCLSSCFRVNKKEDTSNLITIDKSHFFPKEFMERQKKRQDAINKAKERLIAQAIKEDDGQNDGDEQQEGEDNNGLEFEQHQYESPQVQEQEMNENYVSSGDVVNGGMIRTSQVQGITLQNYNSGIYPAVELFKRGVNDQQIQIAQDQDQQQPSFEEDYGEEALPSIDNTNQLQRNVNNRRNQEVVFMEKPNQIEVRNSLEPEQEESSNIGAKHKLVISQRQEVNQAPGDFIGVEEIKLESSSDFKNDEENHLSSTKKEMELPMNDEPAILNTFSQRLKARESKPKKSKDFSPGNPRIPLQ